MKLILKENKKKEKKEWQRELCAREAWLQKENDNRLGDTIICLCDAFVYVHTLENSSILRILIISLFKHTPLTLYIRFILFFIFIDLSIYLFLSFFACIYLKKHI